jgi:hypothetical protein
MPRDKAVVWFVGILIALAVIFYCCCLNHTEINSIGLAYNSLDGTLTVQSTPGWYFTNPFIRVAYISTLPMNVTIPSDAQVIVAKIVRFKPQGVNEYVRLQGFSYSLKTSLNNTLLGYAFSGKEYPFLEIMQIANPENINDLRPVIRGDNPAATH